MSNKYYSDKYYIIQINLKTYTIIKTIHYKITWKKNKAKILFYKQCECRRKESRYDKKFPKEK